MMLPNAIALSLYVLQKTSFMGAQGQPHLTLVVADGIAGAVIGLVVVSVSGFLTPWVAYACGKGLRVSPSCTPSLTCTLSQTTLV